MSTRDGGTAEMVQLYTNMEWRVFPLWWIENGHCACPRGAVCTSPGKHPLFPPAHAAGSAKRHTCRGTCGRVGHGLYDATADAALCERWWTRYPLAHIGLPADANGLAILDVDPKNGGVESETKLRNFLTRKGAPLPPTLTAHTGSGGTHYFFRAPSGGIKGGSHVFGSDMPGLDTRGRGGYVVATPSGHASGGRYEWVDFFADPAPWPHLLTMLMNPPRAAPVPYAGPARPIGDHYVTKALITEVNDVRVTPEGHRNDRLNVAAFNLGQLVGAGLIDEMTVRRELYSAALACGLTEAEAANTILSGLRGGKASPRTRTAA